jgi:hypothetical protein
LGVDAALMAVRSGMPGLVPKSGAAVNRFFPVA